LGAGASRFTFPSDNRGADAILKAGHCAKSAAGKTAIASNRAITPGYFIALRARMRSWRQSFDGINYLWIGYFDSAGYAEL
jgi:hypothetical protein